MATTKKSPVLQVDVKQLQDLQALLWDKITSPETRPQDLSPLSRRWQEVAKELALIEAQTTGDHVGIAAATEDEQF